MTQLKPISIVYKTLRGEIGTQTIVPKNIWFGSTEWHQNEQWFLKAYVLDQQEEQDFAMCDIIKYDNDLEPIQKSANQP